MSIGKITLINGLSEDVKVELLEMGRLDADVEGVQELYNELYILGKCESYNLDRIHLVANRLDARGIEFRLMT